MGMGLVLAATSIRCDNSMQHIIAMNIRFEETNSIYFLEAAFRTENFHAPMRAHRKLNVTDIDINKLVIISKRRVFVLSHICRLCTMQLVLELYTITELTQVGIRPSGWLRAVIRSAYLQIVEYHTRLLSTCILFEQRIGMYHEAPFYQL